jgi:hypothetical protein
MADVKHVKVVFDGQSYWLLWRWRPCFQPCPDDITAAYSQASGPFESLRRAQDGIPGDWTPILYTAQS